jgi:hypothetical protein
VAGHKTIHMSPKSRRPLSRFNAFDDRRGIGELTDGLRHGNQRTPIWIRNEWEPNHE